MPYHTLEEWQDLLAEDLPYPAYWDTWFTAQDWFQQLLYDFEELGYPDDTQWADPLLLRFKNWLLHECLSFSHKRLFESGILRDGAHYQRVGDTAARLATRLGLPQLHPAFRPEVQFISSPWVLHMVPLLATWQTPEAHQSLLHQYAWSWGIQVSEFGLAATWPVFLHVLQWGVVPEVGRFTPGILLAAPDKWQGLAGEPCFVQWCYFKQAAATGITPDAWHEWVSTLPPDHAAHTLAVGRAVQAYEMWATLQSPGQPPNWLTLLQMLEPAPAAVPTGNSPVADFAL